VGAKGASVVTFTETGILEVVATELDDVRWAVVRIDATGAMGVDEILDRTGPAFESVEAEAGGRLVAARVVIEGPTDAHKRLRALDDRLVAEVRGAARGRLWIERVLISTTVQSEGAAEGSIRDLKAMSREIRHTRLGDLAMLLEPLRSKLPPAVALDLRLDDPGALADAVTDAEDYLAALLSGRAS
jgi:hypothetical protein